ncbi:MAG: spore germination protein GerW family protein [Chloroflexota bacterium]
MNVQDVLAQARDAMTVKRVFGEPVEQNGVTVIPVAKVMGGGGGGSSSPAGEAEGAGAGAGYGLRATPVGAYIIRGEHVTWQPALDLNRVILGGQIVAVVLLLTIRAIVLARASRGRR